MKRKFSLLCFLVFSAGIMAQDNEEQLDRADTLRGSLNPERDWWDVQRYDISIAPDFKTKTIRGRNVIAYRKVKKNHPPYMQIDLQEPLKIDSIIYNDKEQLSFTREGNVWHVKTKEQALGSENRIAVYYHGKPREAFFAPWDGGWTFTKDSLDRL